MSHKTRKATIASVKGINQKILNQERIQQLKANIQIDENYLKECDFKLDHFRALMKHALPGSTAYRIGKEHIAKWERQRSETEAEIRKNTDELRRLG